MVPTGNELAHLGALMQYNRLRSITIVHPLVTHRCKSGTTSGVSSELEIGSRTGNIKQAICGALGAFGLLDLWSMGDR